MKIAVYSTKQYDKKYLQHVNDTYGFELEFFDFPADSEDRQNRQRLRSGVYLRQ